MYIALGIPLDRMKEFLGIWVAQTEDTKFWLRVINELMILRSCRQCGLDQMTVTGDRVAADDPA